jgi:prevent-host-death family protein
MAVIMDLTDAKRSLSKLVKRAAAGEDILIASRGKAVAMLTHLPRKRKDLPWGIFKGKIHMTEDFDEPLDVFKNYM